MKKTLAILAIAAILVTVFATLALAAPNTKQGTCWSCYRIRTFSVSYTRNNNGTSHRAIYKCNSCGWENDEMAVTETCTYSNYTQASAATCTQDATETGTCVCGRTSTRTVANSKLGHNYQNYTLTTAATCTENRTETGTCTRCGATDTKEIPNTALGHDYQSTPSMADQVTSATCTAAATYKVKCERCDAVSSTKTVPYGDMLPHSFNTKDSGTEATPATCTAVATHKVQCDNCSAVSDTVTVPYGDMLPHTFNTEDSGIEVDPATCATPATHKVKCDDCDAVSDTKTVPYGDKLTTHTFTNYIPNGDALCLTDGTKTATCDVCGIAQDTLTDEDSALGHDFVRNGNQYECTRCDASYTINHHMGEWTPRTRNRQTATCVDPDCGFTLTNACQLFQHYSLAGDGALTTSSLCPVCGRTEGDAVLALVRNAKLVALDGKLPNGEAIVRLGTLENGAIALSIGVEQEGELLPVSGKVRVYLPEEFFSFSRIALVDQSGVETAIEFTREDGSIVFELDFGTADVSTLALLLTVA